MSDFRESERIIKDKLYTEEAGENMNGNHEIWYAALKARDPKFDGRIFVGVSSTKYIAVRYVGRARRKRRTVIFIRARRQLNVMVIVLV